MDLFNHSKFEHMLALELGKSNIALFNQILNDYAKIAGLSSQPIKTDSKMEPCNLILVIIINM